MQKEKTYNVYEVDIEKEGFLKIIQRGNVNSKKNKNLKDYLFYLNFNFRADVYNTHGEIIYENPYQYTKSIKNLLKNTKGNTIHTLEIIMSFSSTFNKLAGLYYGTKEWKEKYIKEIERIEKKYLNEYLNITSFFHDYDSTMFRVHNHTLVLPYIYETYEYKKKKYNIKLLRPYIKKKQ